MRPARVTRLGGDDVSHLSSLSRFITHLIASRAGRGGIATDRPRIVVQGLRITPARLRRYLKATYGGPAGTPLLPPTLPAIWETGLVLDALRLGGFPFPSGGVLHVGSERVLVRHTGAFEQFDLHLSLGEVRRARGGTRLRLDTELRNPRGQPCQLTQTELLVRGLEPLEEAESRLDPEGEAAGLVELDRWRLPASAGRRYARASGDVNPIHLYGISARPFGFGGAILHGACIEAMIAHRLVAERMAGDPTRLRSLQIRFLAPLVLPGEVVLEEGIGPAAGGSSCRVFRLKAVAKPARRAEERDGRPVAVGSYVAE